MKTTTISMKGAAGVLALAGFILAGTLAGCMSFKMKVRPGNLSASDRNMMGSLIRASKEVRIEGIAQLRPGKFVLETTAEKIQLRVPRGTSMTALLACSNSPSSELQILPGTTLEFDRDVEIATEKSPSVKLRKIAVDGDSTLSANVRLNVIYAFAWWLQRGLGGREAVADSVDIREVFDQLELKTVNLNLRPGATIKLPNQGIGVIGENASFRGNAIRWNAPDDLYGDFVADVSFGPKTELSIQNNKITVEGRLRGLAHYKRVKGAETLEFGVPIETRNTAAQLKLKQGDDVSPLLSIRKAAISEKDKNWAIQLSDFQSTNLHLAWKQIGDRASLTALGKASTRATLNEIPISDGTLSCDSAQIGELSLAVAIGSDVQQGVHLELEKAVLKSWVVSMTRSGSNIKLAGADYEIDQLALDGFKEIRFSIPSSKLKLKSVDFKNSKGSASFAFGAKSLLSLSITNLPIVVFPEPERQATVDSGSITVTGELESANFSSGGKVAKFDRVTVRNSVMVFGGEPHCKGQLQFVCNSGSIRQAILQALGKPDRYDVKMLHIKSIDASIKEVGGTVSFDISGANKGSVNIAMNTGQSSIDVRGESEEPAEDKHSLILGIAVPTISAEYQLADGSKQVTAKIDIQSSRKVCVETERVAKTLGAVSRYWVNVDPFTIHGNATVQISQNASGRIVAQVIDLRSLGNDNIHVDIDSKNMGGFGAQIDIQPWDCEQIRTRAGLGPITVFKDKSPNFIREALRAIVGKEFELSQ